MMGLEAEDHYEPNSTPKLSLSKLPYKPREPPLTPPLHPSLSIPFRWEDAPGKPRAATYDAPPTSSAATPPKNKAARCLELPPRLLLHDDAKITSMPSPTMVLDGPYVGRSLSVVCTFSFQKGLVTGREDWPRPKKKSGGRKFGSGRWGSFKDEEKLAGGNFDFSQSMGRRRRSVLDLSSMNSNLCVDFSPLSISRNLLHYAPLCLL